MGGQVVLLCVEPVISKSLAAPGGISRVCVLRNAFLHSFATSPTAVASVVLVAY